MEEEEYDYAVVVKRTEDSYRLSHRARHRYVVGITGASSSRCIAAFALINNELFIRWCPPGAFSAEQQEAVVAASDDSP